MNFCFLAATQRIAPPRNAVHITAIQSNADRPLATAGFPGRFGPSAPHFTARHGSLMHRNASQSNADRPLATAGFPGRFGPKDAQGAAVQISASRGVASHRTDVQGKAIQSNADRPLATAGFPGCFGPTAWLCTAVQSSAKHGMATHIKATRIVDSHKSILRAALVRRQGNALQITAAQCTASQSNADRSLETGSFPGRFGPRAAHGIAGHCRARQFKATRIGAWQQAFFRAALARRQCVAGKRMASNRSEEHGMEQQFKATRFAHSLSVLTGLFCPPGRVSPAALSTD